MLGVGDIGGFSSTGMSSSMEFEHERDTGGEGTGAPARGMMLIIGGYSGDADIVCYMSINTYVVFSAHISARLAASVFICVC